MEEYHLHQKGSTQWAANPLQSHLLPLALLKGRTNCRIIALPFSFSRSQQKPSEATNVRAQRPRTNDTIRNFETKSIGEQIFLQKNIKKVFTISLHTIKRFNNYLANTRTARQKDAAAPPISFQSVVAHFLHNVV